VHPFHLFRFLRVVDSNTSEMPSMHSRIRKILAGALAVLVVVVCTVAILIHRAGPILRGRVIQTLSDRFHSKVELAAFHVSVNNGLQVSGEGLRIYGQSDPNIHQPGEQALISVAEFKFRAGIWDLLRTPSRIDNVFVRGMTLNLPPKNQRQQIANVQGRGGKAKIFVAHFTCDHAQLVINTSEQGKLPLVFDIRNLKMDDPSPGGPLQFEADLANPKPVGMIHSHGSFGPWQADDPRDTAVKGDYSFDHADLSTIKGVGGILSSQGSYAGTLNNIVVDGKTETPDFRIAKTGHPIPLNTEFHAIVDGTTGDTYLHPVKARIQHTPLVARGFVVRISRPEGHWVRLDVAIDKGKIEDLLWLGVRTDPTVMTGEVQLTTKFDLPPGEDDLSDRLKLLGKFAVANAHFTNAKLQRKIGTLSLRSQGKPRLAKGGAPEDVLSSMSGKFALRAGVLSFSELQFMVPGTEVSMAGKYSLDGNQFDFHGKARMQAKLSHMTTGWKSVLLKPVDPFFSKNGAGTEFPVKVTGTKSEPHFGLDFGHKEDKD